MEHSQAVRPPVHAQDPQAVREISDEDEVRAILSALEDEYCRSILETMTATFCTAQQISEHCDMPISTTYRKLNTLAEVGLVDTSIRLRRSGHHTKEYARAFRSVSVDLNDPTGTAVLIEPLQRS